MPDEVSGPVPGRNHSSTGQMDLVVEAMRLKARGWQWHDIAGVVGYPSPQSIALAVDNFRKQAAVGRTFDEYRTAQAEAIEGLDEFINAWWDKAHDDVDAARVLLSYLTQKHRIQGLDKAKEDNSGGMTLVIGGDEEQYLAGLDAVINDPN